MGEGGIEGIPISIFMFVFLVGTRGGLEGDTRGRFSYIGNDMEEEFKGEEGIEVGKGEGRFLMGIHMGFGFS